MRRTNKKQCPKCQSVNISDTGNKINDVGDMGPNGQYREPYLPIYKCDDCHERFILAVVE